MAHHFIVNPIQIKLGKVTISGEDFEHLFRVLRLKSGDEITVADGSGNLHICVLEDIYKSEAIGKIINTVPDQSESPIEVILLQGLPKGDKLELVIQKATELGVSRVVSVAMQRSVVQLSKNKVKDRLSRWQRIAQEAAKQCRRSRIPLVEYSSNLEEALAQLDEDALILLPWEAENSLGIKEIIKGEKAKDKRQIALVIGPEGGFEDYEVELARQYGAIPLSLGPRILRTETAALAAITIVMYQLGDLGGMKIDE